MEEAKKEVKKPTTNFDIVKKKLCPTAIDSMYLVHCFLLTKQKRAKAAKICFGTESPCAFCWRSHLKHAESEEQCPHYTFPLNICTNNMLRWLDMEAKKRPSKNWLDEENA